MAEKFQEVEAAVKSLSPLIEGLQKDVDGLKASLISLYKENTKTASSQDDLSKKTETGKKATEGLNQIEKKRIQLEEQLKTLRKTSTQENEKLVQSIKEQKKANTEWAKEQLKVTSAFDRQTKELKKAETKYRDLVVQGKENTQQAQALKTKILELSTSLENAKTKTVNARKEEEKLTKTEKEAITLKQQLKEATSKEALENEKLRLKLQQQKKATNETAKAELGLINIYQRESKRLNTLRNDYKNLVLTEGANTKQAKALKKEVIALDNRLKKLDSSVGQNFRSVGNYSGALNKLKSNILGMVATYVSFQAAIRIFGNSLKSIISFEKGLSEVKAITGATAESFNLLKNNALELGSSTQKSALEVAQLQKEFAKLGFSTDEILNATEATINLSIAAGSDLAESAVVAASTVRGFGADAKDTQQYVDVMAKSFTSSALDLEKFKTAMGIVAPVAKSAGKDIEFTTAQIAVLADAGVDASTAGTSLRNMFLELSKKGMTWEEGLEAINTSTNKNVTALDLFGKRGATASLILADNTEKAERLEKTFDNAAGSAKEMADIMADNLAGDIGKAKSAWEGLILTIGNNNTMLRKATQFFTKMLGNITGSIKPHEKKINLYTLENKELNVLFGSLKNTNLSQEARNKLIDKINSDYGEYLPNLLTEKSTLEEIEAAQIAVNKQLRLKIIQQAFQEEINDLLKAELNAQENIVQAELDRESISQRRMGLMTEQEAALLDAQEGILTQTDLINQHTLDNNDKEVESTKEKFKRIGELYGIAFDEISKILEEQDEKTELSISEEIAKKSHKDEILLRAAERRAKYLDTIREKEQSAFLQGMEDENQAFEDSITEQVDTEYDLAIQSINDIETERLRILTEAAEKEIALKEKTEEAKKELAEKALESAFEYASSLYSSKIDTELEEYEAEQEAQADILQTRLDNGEISEAEYAEAIAELEAKTEEKRAKAEKKKALFSVAIETAKGAIKAIATSPETFGLPYLPYVIAQGGIQAAAIAATPLGAFKDGTPPDGTNKDMFAKVSELGTELGIFPSGEQFLTPSKETTMFLPEGTRIFSHNSPETQAALQGGITQEHFNMLISEERKTRKAIMGMNKKSGYEITTKGLKLRDKELGINRTYINKKIRW